MQSTKSTTKPATIVVLKLPRNEDNPGKKMTTKKNTIPQEKLRTVKSLFKKKNADKVTIPAGGKSEKVPQRQTEQSNTTSSNSNRFLLKTLRI